MSKKPGKAANKRALTKVLEEYGDRSMVDQYGNPTTFAEETARLMWEVATKGKAEFVTGDVIKASTRDWKDLVSWIYNQVDGPKKLEQEIQLTGVHGELRSASTQKLVAMVQELDIGSVLGLPATSELPETTEEEVIDAEEVE